jgi:hypothetical protein
MNKKNIEDTENYIKNKFPNARRIEKVEDAKNGELVIIKGTVKSGGIRISPKLFFPDEKNDDKDLGLESEFLEIPFKIENGYLFKENKGLNSFSTHSDEYNNIISLFNILGLPLDFCSTADVQLFVEDSVKKPIKMNISDKAERRGKDIPPVKITKEEKSVLLEIMNVINDKLKDVDIDGIEDIIKFFGYANYYLFHNNLHLAFINSWMFIEPYINQLWIKSTKEMFNGLKYNPLKEERNWTLQQKIDELFMMGKIKSDTRERLQQFRSKRNKVFHVDIKPQKRKVEIKDAVECFLLANRLFYKMLGYPEGKILRSDYLYTIRNKIGIAIYGDGYLHNSVSI